MTNDTDLTDVRASVEADGLVTIWATAANGGERVRVAAPHPEVARGLAREIKDAVGEAYVAAAEREIAGAGGA